MGACILGVPILYVLTYNVVQSIFVNIDTYGLYML